MNRLTRDGLRVFPFALVLAMLTLNASAETFTFEGQELSTAKMFAFKNIRLGLTLPEFRELTAEASGFENAKVICSTDVEYPGRRSTSNTTACLFCRETADKTFQPQPTTIANVPAHALFVFAKARDAERLIQVRLKVPAAAFDQIRDALNDRYGGPTRLRRITRYGNQLVEDARSLTWTNSDSGIALVPYAEVDMANGDYEVTYFVTATDHRRALR